MKKLNDIPTFANEQEEREFWLSHDSADYVDWSGAVQASFPNLKRSSKTISLRLPVSLIDNLKIMANKRDVPYQSLMKVILNDAVRAEWTKPS